MCYVCNKLQCKNTCSFIKQKWLVLTFVSVHFPNILQSYKHISKCSICKILKHVSHQFLLDFVQARKTLSEFPGNHYKFKSFLRALKNSLLSLKSALQKVSKSISHNQEPSSWSAMKCRTQGPSRIRLLDDQYCRRCSRGFKITSFPHGVGTHTFFF